MCESLRNESVSYRYFGKQYDATVNSAYKNNSWNPAKAYKYTFHPNIQQMWTLFEVKNYFFLFSTRIQKSFRQYDYIIKAETSTEDAPIILNQIDYNETELEHRNTADGSLADDPAAVGSVYKDIARVDQLACVLQ